MPRGTNAPKLCPADPLKCRRIVSSGSPSGPCRRVNSQPSIVPTTRFVLRIGNVAETVERAIESVRSTLELKDIELILDVPYDLPPVHHDTDAITQCIVNLVSNAAKYSPGGSRVRLHGRVVEGVELTISDEGIGIAAHDLRKIFDPFYRSRDSLARRQKGTGIGLTITRYIIEAHGGSISVQSRPGKGSTFTLRFPNEPTPPPARGTI